MTPLTFSDIDVNAAKLLGHEYASKFQVLPIKHENDRLWVAMVEPDNRINNKFD